MPNKKRDDESNKEVILGFLKKNPDQHLTTAEIVSATSLKREQVTSSLHAMRRTMGPFVRRVGHAVWVYTPHPRGAEVDGKLLYEEIGQVDNRKVVRDPNGELFELTPLSKKKPLGE